MRLPKIHAEKSQSMMVCKVHGRFLYGASIVNATARSISHCLLICTNEPRCLSANYHKVTMLCSLNDSLDLDKPEADYMMDDNYVHLMTRACHGPHKDEL